jgi:hypothetical protein
VAEGVSCEPRDQYCLIWSAAHTVLATLGPGTFWAGCPATGIVEPPGAEPRPAGA